METWDYAKTIVLYLEHIAMVLVGFMSAFILRTRKYNALKTENSRKDMIIETYRRDMVAYKQQDAIAEKEEMKARRRAQEKEKIQTETPKALLNIAHLFGTEFIKKQFPSGGIIK